MNLIEIYKSLINAIYGLLRYDINVCGYNLELWSFMVSGVVLGGMVYIITRGVLNND